ncbi:MAG: AAA family ATPase, partial [Actinobacteria bacterium]|nr:AAA family ATPase [Actinomycetota bacterium]
MSSLARDGEILVGRRTRVLLPPEVIVRRTRRHGSWRLVNVDGTLASIPRRLDRPMIGRDVELRQIEQAFTDVAENGRCQVLTILGAAGIGKSRIAREFSDAIRSSTTLLTSRCPSYGEGITLWPLIDIIRQATGGTSRETVLRLLHGEDRDIVAERIVSTAAGSEELSDFHETFWAFKRFLECIAVRRPLCLVIDDLHWGAPSFLDFLEYVADWSRKVPLFILCLARPDLLDDRASWGGGRVNSTCMLLEGLCEDAVHSMMAELAQGEELTVEARARVARTAEGNPLFLEQMIAMASDRRLQCDLDVPPTIQALLAVRLDGLPPEERRVIEAASVIGRRFSLEAVVELLQADLSQTRAVLGSLIRRELVAPAPDLADVGIFEFRHGLIRDSAHRSVSRVRLADLHERCARWAAQDSGREGADVDETVGYHLEQAFRHRVELEPNDPGCPPLAAEAAKRLAQAGVRARKRSDVTAAIRLLSRAAELSSADYPLRNLVVNELGVAFRDSGNWGSARECFVEALRWAEEHEDRIAVLLLRNALLLLRLHAEKGFTLDEFITKGSRLLRAFEDAGEPRHAGQAQHSVAWAYFLTGRALEAERLILRNIAVAKREDDEQLMTASNNLLVSVWTYG